MEVDESGSNKPSKNHTTWVQLTPGSFVTGKASRIRSDVKNEAEGGGFGPGLIYVYDTCDCECVYVPMEMQKNRSMHMDAMLHTAFI